MWIAIHVNASSLLCLTAFLMNTIVFLAQRSEIVNGWRKHNCMKPCNKCLRDLLHFECDLQANTVPGFDSCCIRLSTGTQSMPQSALDTLHFNFALVTTTITPWCGNEKRAEVRIWLAFCSISIFQGWLLENTISFPLMGTNWPERGIPQLRTLVYARLCHYYVIVLVVLRLCKMSLYLGPSCNKVSQWL